MRASFFTLLTLATYSSAAILWVRQTTPPPCSALCLNTATNNISTGTCAASDLACLCASEPYVQGVINCLATECSSQADVSTGIQYSTAFCGAAGVNTGPAGVTTPTAQLSPTAGGSHTGNVTTPPMTSQTAASTTTHTGGAERVNMVTSSVIVGALVLVAGAMGF